MKIELVVPEIVDGKEIKELEFREPLGGDLEEVLGEFSSGDKKVLGGALTKLASTLVVSHPISIEDFRGFKAKNYMAIMGEMSAFLS